MNKIATLLIATIFPFIVYSQSLVSVSPDTANAGQTLDVTISGSHTHFNQGSGTTVSFGFKQGNETVINSMSIVNDSVINVNVTVPANTYEGIYSVSSYCQFDGTRTYPNGFYVIGTIPPTITSIVPNSANVGQTLDVTITGTNTHFGVGSGTYIKFGFNQGSSTSVNSMSIVNDTSIQANITVPANTAQGFYNVYAYDSTDGLRQLTYGFDVTGNSAASIISVSPGNANAGQTLDVTITGANTHFSQGSGTYIDFGSSGIIINSYNIASDLSIQANISVPSNTSSGYYNVDVGDIDDGYLTRTNGFFVDGISATPALTSIAPDSAYEGQTLDVTITGVNTHFNQGSSTSLDFSFNPGPGSVVNSLNIINATSIQANITVPQNTQTGDYDVIVSDAFDGAVVLLNGFHVTDTSSAAFLMAGNPQYLFPGSTSDIIINGYRTHFTEGDLTTLIVGINGSVVNTLTILNDTSIGANITIPDTTRQGVYNMYVTDSIDGMLTLNAAVFVITSVISNGANTDLLVKTYPNPCSGDKLTIELLSPSAWDESSVVSLYNVQGQLMMQQTLTRPQAEIYIGDFSNGLYLLKVQNNRGSVLKRIVKN